MLETTNDFLGFELSFTLKEEKNAKETFFKRRIVKFNTKFSLAYAIFNENKLSRFSTKGKISNTKISNAK